MEKFIFARMSKDLWFSIPENIRKQIINFRVEKDDFEQLMEDEKCKELYKKYKKAKDEYNNYKFKIRNK